MESSGSGMVCFLLCVSHKRQASGDCGDTHKSLAGPSFSPVDKSCPYKISSLRVRPKWLKRVPPTDFIVLLGDFSAHVGNGWSGAIWSNNLLVRSLYSCNRSDPLDGDPEADLEWLHLIIGSEMTWDFQGVGICGWGQRSLDWPSRPVATVTTTRKSGRKRNEPIDNMSQILLIQHHWSQHL